MEFDYIKNLYHLKEEEGFSEEVIQKACKTWGTLPDVFRNIISFF